MDFPAAIDFGENGGGRRFDDEASVLKFLANEKEAWNFVQRIPQNSSMPSLRELYEKTIGASDNYRAQVYAGGRNPNAVDAVFNNIKSNLSRSRFPLSFSEMGKRVQDIRQEYGDATAIGFLARELDIRFDSGIPAQLEGMLLSRELSNVTSRRAKTALQRSFRAIVSRAEETQAELESTLEQTRATGVEGEDQRRSQTAQTLADARDKLEDALFGARDKVDQAIAKIQTTDATYKGFMTLKGPVTYWKEKAKSHRKNSMVAQVVGLVYALISLVFVFRWGADDLISTVEKAVLKTHEWQISYIVLIVALFVLTVVFWIGRLISRLYVSEQHLAVDAEERATMVMTYLALANDDKVSPTERAIVLASLFRPSADGLVRDDGAPDLSLAGIVSKYVTAPK